MKIIYFSALMMMIFFYSCGTSTGSRYEKKPKVDQNVKKSLNEEFDISAYKVNLDIKDTAQISDAPNDKEDIWFGYNADNNEKEELVNKAPGYRVHFFTSDVIEEAESAKIDVGNKIKSHIYLIFEPPFYKVLAGDFAKEKDAAELSFQLSQQGYTESKVIRDTVNIYRK